MSLSSLPSDFLIAMDEYGEDATRLAVNAAGGFEAVTDVDVASWRRVVDTLWQLRTKVAYNPDEVATNEHPKKVILLHGRNSSPQEIFWPWVKTSLLAHGFEVISPEISQKGQGDCNSWKATFEELKPLLDQHTTVIAHSMAALAFCKFLSDDQSILLHSLHFIGGVFDDFIRPFQPDDVTNQARSFLPKTINYSSIASRVKHIHIHHSSDDSRVIFSSAQRYIQAFAAGTIHTYSNRDHFQNQVEFSELVSIIAHDFMPPKNSIILDFDGVLADTWEATYSTRMAISRMTKAEAIEHERGLLSKPYHAKRMPDIASKLEAKEVWQKQYRKTFAALRPQLFSEFVEILKAIPNARFAIVSSGEKPLMESLLENSGLQIDAILDYKHHYSKEEKVEEVCKMWGINPKESWYITDTQADVVELQEVLTVSRILGCSWGYHGAAALLEVLPNENVLMRAQDIFIGLKLNPHFVLSPAAQTAFRQVQELIHDEETPAAIRLESLKKCVDECANLAYIPHQIWAEIIMAFAPFAPVISEELWCSIPLKYRMASSVHQVI